MSKSETPLGNLEIKKTSWGFLIEKDGESLEIRDTKTFGLLRILVNAIRERDFEMITNLLPKSFMSATIYYDANKKIRDRRIAFLSDSPDFSSKFKANLESNQVFSTEPECFAYGDSAIFSRDIDLILAFHRLPHGSFFFQLNRFCLDRGVQFVKAMIDNCKFVVTPFLLPYESACYNCYNLLKTRNQIFDRDTVAAEDFIHISGAHPPDFMIQLCADFLVVMLVRILATERFLQQDLAESVLDFATIEISKHPLLRVPFCDACNPRSKRR